MFPIQGTFDIAIARNTLRRKISGGTWTPTFNARAAAALTALGELILAIHSPSVVLVNLTVYDDPDEQGVEFSCDVRLPEHHAELSEPGERLERACDSVEVEEVGGHLYVSAKVWMH